jgi:hypothetical protein
VGRPDPVRCVGALARDLDVAVVREHQPQPLARERLVLDDQHPERHRPAPLSVGSTTARAKT